MFRIPPPEGKRGKPVFLQHGYATNSEIFLLAGMKSLALVLARHGFDVWLANGRGTRYSYKHINVTITEEEYWNFSFDEMGLYDLPTCLSYIGDLTKQKITYFGLSLGTLTMFVYSTVYPDEAYNRVDMFVNLAPSVFLYEYGLGLRFVIANWEYIEPTLRTLGAAKEFWSAVLSHFVRFACFPFPFQMKMCMTPLMLLFGFNYGQHDPETLPMLLLQAPENASLRIFRHGVQVALSGGPAPFNYGNNKTNMQMYGTEQPIPYDLTKMRVPTYLIRARNDQVVTKAGVEALVRILPKDVTRYGVHEVENDEFCHIDFVFGKDVVELVYDPVAKFLKTLPI